MPRPNKSARAQPGSNSSADPPQKAAPPGPQFTKSKQSSPPQCPDRRENPPDSADWLSLDATEPFPPGLFRVPIPNAVFDRMPEMSDSALRCLLALIHLSFRFDPAEGEWVHARDWFNRSDIEDECGLSGQGTRNGLDELKSMEWVRADRSGRSHQYQLTIEVPSRRFTYVPTSLLENASGIDSGTELRVVLAVLRETWGWTCKETNPESGQAETVHDRWAQLSNRELAKATGRSKTAVAQAAKALQGAWIERVRPGSGSYQYRFLPEAVGDGSGNSDSFSEENANDLTPDRQKSGTPTSNKESSSKDKHSQPQKKNTPEPTGTNPPENGHAVPMGNNPGKKSNSRDQEAQNEQSEETTTPDFGDLPPEKQELAEKLANVGVWAGRIAEILSRFSCTRIRANFQLYRQRAAEQMIRKPGAWLYRAITEGYALPEEQSVPGGSNSTEESGPRPALGHKEIVSEAKKDAYVAQGLPEERFHRCLSPDGATSEPTFMYFAPDEEGPGRCA